MISLITKRPFLFSWTVLGISAGSVCIYKNKTDELFRRNVYFWRNVTPIFLHYKLKEFKFKYFRPNADPKERSEEFEVLHEKYSDKVLEIIMTLRGFYVKIGQLASQRVDTVPIVWGEKLRRLESKMKEKPFSEVRKTVEDSLGNTLESTFSSFDTFPIGCASIGQVHRAVLRDTGEEVAVKVLHNDAKKYFLTDLRTLNKFARIAQKELLPFLSQWESVVEEEFDCRIEAKKMEGVRRNLKDWSRTVIVPRIFERLVTENMLVMEYLEGEELSKLFTKLISSFRETQKIEGAPRRSLKSMAKEFGKEQSWGKWLRLASGLILEDFATLIWNFCYILSLGFLPKSLFPESRLHILRRLKRHMHTLNEVHAHEVFVDGLFNPDPHGGNVLVLPDGRLGLLDFGQAKRVDIDFRKNFARLLVALDREDWESVVKINRKLGFRTRNDDPEALRSWSSLFFGYGNTSGLVLPQYIKILSQVDQPLEYPTELFLAGKMAMTLRAMSKCVWGDVSMARRWRPFAEKFLEGEGVSV